MFRLLSLTVALAGLLAAAPDPAVAAEKLRQLPVILVPDEFQVAVVHAQLPSLVFDYDFKDERRVPVRVTLVQHLGREGNRLKVVPLNKADPLPPGHTYAIRIDPRRLGIIAGSFPYKKQVEEFRRKLLLATHGDVLAERVKGDKNESWDAFQFRGLVVERMTLFPLEQGRKPVWEALPLVEAYKELLLDTANQIEPDDARYNVIKKVSRSLVMPLPKQFPRDLRNPNEKRYPDLFVGVKNINAALGKIPKGFVPEIAVPFGPDDPPPMPRPKIKEIPFEHCLFRFIDVTLEAGKEYRYRLKVKMANPNNAPKPAERKDTLPRFARDRELESEWFEVPQTLVVPPESLVYAIDPHRVKAVRFTRPHDERYEVVVQIQRWVEYYPPAPVGKADERPVGDWVVADRIIVSRGEFVRDRAYRTPIPIKYLGATDFTLDENSVLEFGDESVLVDFEGGRVSHPRVTAPVEQVSTEILVMTPNGRVYARNDRRDSMDSERIERYSGYLRRVKSIKDRTDP